MISIFPLILKPGKSVYLEWMKLQMQETGDLYSDLLVKYLLSNRKAQLNAVSGVAGEQAHSS